MGLKENIRRERLHLGLTLEDVANKIGVRKATVQRYESGAITNISTDTIEKLAEALETTPGKLMGWDNNPSSADVVQESITTYGSNNISKKQARKIETIAAHLEDKTLTDKKIELLKQYIDALFDDE